MRVVGHDEFVAMPAGTLYARWEPTIFGELLIKGESFSDNDWWVQQLLEVPEVDSLLELDDGKTVRLDLNLEGRDAMYDRKRRFVVFDAEDVKAIIERLQRCL